MQRVMKLTLLLICGFMFSLSAGVRAQAQMVTLKVEGSTFKEVIAELKRQTSLDFFYSFNEVDVDRRVSLDVKNERVDDVLRLLLGDRFVWEYADGMVIIKPVVAADDEKSAVRIVGTVRDERRQPMPGVTVQLKGIPLGTATDVNGWYALEVPRQENMIFVYSFIGMETQEIKYTGQDTINVVMKVEATDLDEVTVISDGYRTMKPTDITGAIDHFDAEDLVVPGIQSIDKMLEGRVPGMTYMANSGQVGAVPRLRIRGTSTILGNQEPLWVVDGIVQRDPINVDPERLNDLDFVNLLGNAISGLNPEDIESIDVLKDAAATAIYGTKASNGVIVITTKKGKQGPPSISYSFTSTFTRRPHYEEKTVDMMNSRERIALSRQMIEQGVQYPGIDTWVGYEDAIHKYYNDEISYEEMERQISRYETVNTDWFDLLTRNAFSHGHTLSLSGGTSEVRYYISAGLRNNQGTNIGELNRNYSTTANITANYDKFSVQFSLNGNVEKRKYSPSDVGATTYAYQTSRAVPAYNEDGSLWYYWRGLAGDSQNTIRFNILEDVANSLYEINTNRLSMNAMVTWHVTHDLNFSGTFSYSFSNSYQDTYYGENTYHTRSLKYPYGEKYGLGSGVENANDGVTEAPYGGVLEEEDQQNNNYTLRLQLSYNRYLDKEHNHHLNFMAGWELNSSHYLGTQRHTRGYLPDRGKQIAQVDLEQYPALRDWYRDEPLAVGVFTDNLTNTVSGFASLSYTLFEDYTFNINGRADASNKFGSNSNNRLLPIWSVSGRWNIKNSLLRSLNFVNELTLRTSFGYQGNMLEDESPEMILSRGSYDARYEEFESTLDKFANPNLKWEKTASFNASVDFSLLKGHISGTFSYFYRKTKNAFLTKEVSRAEGVENYTVNAGTVENKGTELSLRIRLIDSAISRIGQLTSASAGSSSGFRWDFDPGIGSVLNQLVDNVINRNEHNETLHDEYEYNDYLSGNVQIPGRALNAFYSYRFKGLDPTDGRPMFYGAEENYTVNGFEVLDNNGNPISNDSRYAGMTREQVILDEVMEYSGKRVPVIQGGIVNTFQWKRMVLSFNLSYSLGSKIRLLNLYDDVSMSNNSIAPLPLSNVRREFLNRWQFPGDEQHTNIPGIISGYDFTSTMTPWWRDKPYEFAGSIWDMYNYANIRVVSGNYMKLQSLSFRYLVPEKICRKLYMKSAYVSFATTNLFTICSKDLRGQSPTQNGGSANEINMSERPTFSLNINVTF